MCRLRYPRVLSAFNANGGANRQPAPASVPPSAGNLRRKERSRQSPFIPSSFLPSFLGNVALLSVFKQTGERNTTQLPPTRSIHLTSPRLQSSSLINSSVLPRALLLHPRCFLRRCFASSAASTPMSGARLETTRPPRDLLLRRPRQTSRSRRTSHTLRYVGWMSPLVVYPKY